ncbi:class I SAM-dependent methyltransferase [Micromonospora eburnea]|uniref:Methyltransferase domain-containing protein n=1 Tax=Micromonospora eburnea TaxID=227316 RepID=A0A1C6U4D1_9ACTN|nr:class I SAM-dependent methyltransferase [Micromonospora eburnea]SCL48771.1 Methyltransferase domain-containing protein [Micromonospora eburnea]
MSNHPVWDRVYETYTSDHAGLSDRRACSFAYRRDIRPHLRPATERPCRVLDIGCGQGDLVGLMQADGIEAYGVDISPEQVEVARSRGLDRVCLGDFHSRLRAEPGTWDAVVATDILEHLSKDDVVRTFDEVRAALRPGGRFLARVPNAVSPTGGHIMYGDITHRTWFTRRSVAQLAAVAGFESVRISACPPPVHGFASLVRSVVWSSISATWKVALAAETGQLRGHIVTQNLVFVARRSEHAGMGKL